MLSEPRGCREKSREALLSRTRKDSIPREKAEEPLAQKLTGRLTGKQAERKQRDQGSETKDQRCLDKRRDSEDTPRLISEMTITRLKKEKDVPKVTQWLGAEAKPSFPDFECSFQNTGLTLHSTNPQKHHGREGRKNLLQRCSLQ